MKKNKQKSRSNQAAKKMLCGFGLPLKPRCGKYYNIYDLKTSLVLRQDLEAGRIPPYCYKITDDEKVHMDQCVACFLEHGLSLVLYEKINYLLTGITRENYKVKLAIFEFYVPDATKHIDAMKKELIQEMIKDGMPVDMGLRNLHDC